MFHAIHFMDRNHAANQNLVFARYRKSMGKYLVVLDGDIIIEHTEPCWLARLIQIAEKILTWRCWDRMWMGVILLTGSRRGGWRSV